MWLICLVRLELSGKHAISCHSSSELPTSAQASPIDCLVKAACPLEFDDFDACHDQSRCLLVIEHILSANLRISHSLTAILQMAPT